MTAYKSEDRKMAYGQRKKEPQRRIKIKNANLMNDSGKLNNKRHTNYSQILLLNFRGKSAKEWQKKKKKRRKKSAVKKKIATRLGALSLSLGVRHSETNIF